ncbi:MAG: nucleoside deaminase [Thermodesulfobacteriota bacterium]|nr:MAG: nucleoside deaminase [Thermodesulfobacteriota bacterium]
MSDKGLKLVLPKWVAGFVEDREASYPDIEDRMRLVIDLARKNIEAGTGGPFGAAVFDMRTHRLISVGINQVELLNCSVLHAEIVALILAQEKSRNYDLGASGMPECELVSSVEPCAMCFGAIPWSGIRRLAYGASEKDVEAIGFDEGDKVDDWAGSLIRRGIDVQKEVCRTEADKVLKEYKRMGGKIYNPRRE